MRLFITAFVFLLSSISLSQGWPEGTIYKSQNPNEVIPKKTVTINGAKFDAYLCKEYRDWNDGSYTKLKSKYWYILPHDSLAISAIRDTSNTWNYRDDLWYLPYLDGTIENGYFNYYDNGSIESIGVSNKTWPLSNKTKIFNGLDDDHMFPIKNKWYKPDVKIDCDEYGSCIKTISYEAVDCGMSISRGKGLSNSDEDKFLDDFLSKALVIKQDFINLNEDFRLHIILRKFGGESTSDYNEGQLRICLGGKFKEYNNGKTYYSWGFDMATENDEDHDAFQIIKDRRKQNYSSEYITIKTTRVRKGIKFQTNKQSKYNVDYSTLDPWMFNVNLIKISENLFFNLNDKTKLVEKFIPYKTNNIALKAMNYSNDTQIWEVLITQEIDIEEYLKPNRVYNVTE